MLSAGRGEQATRGQDGLSGGSQQERQESAGLLLALGPPDDPAGLTDRRVAGFGQEPGAGFGFEQRPGCDNGVGISGAGVLVCLPDIFPQQDFRLKLRPQSGVLEPGALAR